MHARKKKKISESEENLYGKVGDEDSDWMQVIVYYSLQKLMSSDIPNVTFWMDNGVIL